MKIIRVYRKLENIEEVQVYSVQGDEFYRPAPQEFDVENTPFPKLLTIIPIGLHILLPYNDGDDFIIMELGKVSIKRGNFSQDDVRGRLLSKVSPVFHEVFYESLFEVYLSHNLKNMRFFYHIDDKLISVTNIKIFYENGMIFLLTDNVDTAGDDSTAKDYGEDRSSMMKYFSQTGSYNKVNGKFSWSQGIYNIINRPREESDKYYNIVFDLVIPQDMYLIDRIHKIIDDGAEKCEETIRIRSVDGKLKYIELSICSEFDKNGDLISIHGLMNDITHHSKKPVDFLLNGFRNSKKLALLIEPLNTRQYEFSQGFYELIEIPPQDYYHSRDVIYNIVEKQTIENIIKLADGELDEIDETFTYDVGGRQKICELYIERFEFGNEIHSIGFLSDVSEEKRKQNELINANEYQKVLIKEIHHRVKNNLQILNSFLNLEKRVYSDNSDVIVSHMQSRLTSLAILYEKIYDSSDFRNINLNEFIINQDNQYKTLLSLNDIQFISKIDETLNLSIEVITPFSLLINELTMNSIKHAFPDKTMSDKKIVKKIA